MQSPKVVYQLDEGGLLLGAALADPSPLAPGVFLLPAGCVEEAPPPAPEGQRARYTNGAWILEAVPYAPPDEPPSPLPPTKATQIAGLLAPSGQTRLTIQLSIELAETIARLKAPAYGLTEEQAIAYAYSKNKSYRECKDLEAAIRLVETS